MPPVRRPAAARVLTHVEVQDGHWIWTGSIDDGGYGYTHDYALDGSLIKHRGVHVIMYEHYVGPIPPGHDVDHLCRVRRCCCPDHLEAVTHQENLNRGEGYSHVVARTNRCGQGHSMQDALVGRDGKRRCRTCRNEWRRNRHAAGLPR